MRFETKILPVKYSYLAPDGSEIRLLPNVIGGGLAHCTIPSGCVSKPVYHKTVEEIWYFIEGQGEVWRNLNELEEITDVYAGLSLTVPVATKFQFRNTGAGPLRFIIATIPQWPGPQEAEEAVGAWTATETAGFGPSGETS